MITFDFNEMFANPYWKFMVVVCDENSAPSSEYKQFDQYARVFPYEDDEGYPLWSTMRNTFYFRERDMAESFITACELHVAMNSI